MKNKGFTLIELLAVIVILAIIALIATPMITGIINTAKKGGAESSALGWIDAVEYQVMTSELKGLDINKNATYYLDELISFGVKARGQKPSSAKVVLDKGKVSSGVFCIGDYKVEVSNSKIISSTKVDTCSLELVSGLYDEHENLIASWDELVNTYGLNISSDFDMSNEKYYMYVPEDMPFNDVLQDGGWVDMKGDTSESLDISNVESNQAAIAIAKASKNVKNPILVIGNEVDSIGKLALFGSNVSKIIIKNPNIQIEEQAFMFNLNLKNVVLPEGITSISDGLFSRCYNLQHVVIPSTVTSIGEESFGDCLKLTDIAIPSSVVSIGPYAFYYCESLKNIVLPEGITSIGESTFENCINLETVNIPSSVTSIESEAFDDCENLKSISLPSGLTYIGYNAFSGCKKLKNIDIPDGVTIKSGAFYDCISLESVRLPSNITKIEQATFYNCKKLKNIIIPDSVTEIGMEAFYSCHSLASVSISKNVTNLDKGVFENCRGLKAINVDENNENYKSVDGILFSKNGNTLIQYPIGKPDTSYVVSSTVNEIDFYAFKGSSNLKSVIISEGVWGINHEAFKDCTGLTSITLPKSIGLLMNWNHFEGCINLKEIKVADGNEKYESINGVLFEKENKILLFYPPAKSSTSYIVPDGTTTIRGSAFKDAKNLQNVTISSTVTRIEWNSFENCSNLKNISIPSSVTYIGHEVFKNCSNLENVTFENTNGWTVKDYYSGSSEPEAITVTNSSKNANYFVNQYCKYDWERK